MESDHLPEGLTDDIDVMADTGTGDRDTSRISRSKVAGTGLEPLPSTEETEEKGEDEKAALRNGIFINGHPLPTLPAVNQRSADRPRPVFITAPTRIPARRGSDGGMHAGAEARARREREREERLDSLLNMM